MLYCCRKRYEWTRQDLDVFVAATTDLTGNKAFCVGTLLTHSRSLSTQETFRGRRWPLRRQAASILIEVSGTADQPPHAKASELMEVRMTNISH